MSSQLKEVHRERGMERWGDGEMGRWGDGEMGRWGDGEMGRWGDGEGERIHSFMPAARAVCLYSSRALPESPIMIAGVRPI